MLEAATLIHKSYSIIGSLLQMRPPCRHNAADLAKGAAARLAGCRSAEHDTEKTFPDLKARLAKTVAFVQSFDPMTLMVRGS